MKRTISISIVFLVLLTGGILNAAQNRGLATPKGMLPLELQRVKMRDFFAGSGIKEAGIIQNIAGHVVVAKEDLSSAYFAAPGDKLYEKDLVFTLAASRCRFKLNTEDVVTMAEKTRIGIKNYADNRQKCIKSSLFQLVKGKALFYTVRLLRYKETSMDVETPTAVSGVRGTKFGVEIVERENPELGRLPLLVADASPLAGFLHLAQAAGGIATIFHGFEGTISVRGKADGLTRMLGAGQSLNVTGMGTGNAYPTSPGVYKDFMLSTQAGTGNDQGEKSDSSGNAVNEGYTGTPFRDTATQTQTQTQTRTQESSQHQTPPPQTPPPQTPPINQGPNYTPR